MRQRVALRKESVDRNIRNRLDYKALSVALRKESVDRNANTSLSAQLFKYVALRKESVDRNAGYKSFFTAAPRRSPQGERG